MTLHVGARNHIEEALAGYEITDEALRHVATKGDGVIDALKMGFLMIQKYFGPGVAARIILEPDREIPGFQPIVVEIRTPATARDSFERMQRFQDEWWLDAMRGEAGEICFLVVPE